MSDVFSDLATILTENFEVDGKDIESQVTLDDLGVDSVAAIELVDMLQQKYGIKVSDDEVTKRNTVEQVVGTVTAKIGV